MVGESTVTGSLSARLLIILYGLGIVAIGAYPIQREHGGILNYLSSQSSAFASEGLSELKKSGLADRLRRRRATRSGVDQPEVQTLTLPGASLKVQKRAPAKEMDKLTKQDRAALENLIDGL